MLTALECVHRFVTGEEAEDLLKSQGKDGSFLIRPSSLSPDDLSLSVRRKDEIMHIRIQNTGEYYDLYGGEQFASLPQLIEYYTKGEGKDQLVEKSGKQICLTNSIPAPKHREERWFHPNLTAAEAEEKLKNMNEIGIFLVRERGSKARDFVLSCLVKEDEVVHVIVTVERGKYTIGDGTSYPSLSILIDTYRSKELCVKHGKTEMKFILQKSLTEGTVYISKLDARIAELEKDFDDQINCKDDAHKNIKRNGFSEEFAQVQHADNKEDTYARLQSVGGLPVNKKKNRYRNILPYDETIVVLKNVDPRVAGSDYINANYIKIKEVKRTYIATQGCVKLTVGDFWNMVWAENISLIVMITELVEKQKHKCQMYWPNEDEILTLDLFSGPISIQLEATNHRDDYVIRNLLVKHCNETRSVYHYQHLKWPDKCTPKDVSGSVEFLLEINAKSKELSLPENSIWLIHCSAGIGRTGCFILIDVIINLIKKKGVITSVNIPSLLLEMRSQRAGLVQTDKQYTFVYKAVQCYVNNCLKCQPSFDNSIKPPTVTKPKSKEELYENFRK